MVIRYSINPLWCAYDKVVAKVQLENYHMIFLDEYGLPIDDIEHVEELYQQYKWGKRR
jgi:hypothetical protein